MLENELSTSFSIRDRKFEKKRWKNGALSLFLRYITRCNFREIRPLFLFWEFVDRDRSVCTSVHNFPRYTRTKREVIFFFFSLTEGLESNWIVLGIRSLWKIERATDAQFLKNERWKGEFAFEKHEFWNGELW